ncbi:MAG: DUF6328 family protein [Pseudomonadota bacterium]
MSVSLVEPRQRAIERETLKEESDQLLSEARMVLPGIQALLGFQTIAVFSQRFETLAMTAQYAHLLALLLFMAAIVFVMAPAAFYRIARPGAATRRILDLSSRFLWLATLSLSLALALDAYVVSSMILASEVYCIILAAAVFVFCLLNCFALPVRARRNSYFAATDDEGREQGGYLLSK